MAMRFPVKLLSGRMQNYATLCDKIIQQYIIRGDISPHIRRLIVVIDRFCGDNRFCGEPRSIHIPGLFN